MMDGLNSAFRRFALSSLFCIEEATKWLTAAIGAAWRTVVSDVLLARTVNATELFVYSWPSIAAAVGIANRAKWHRTLEVIVLSLAAYGGVGLVFVLPELLHGCPNMQPMGVHDCFPPLTPFYFFYV